MVPVDPRTVQGLVSKFVAGDSNRSVVVECPDHQLTVAVAADVPRPVASILKLPLVLAVHDAARAGASDLQALVANRALRPTRFPSLLDTLRPDHQFSIEELIGFALATSDNLVANHLLGLVGMDRVNDLLADIGCDHTRLAADFSDANLGESGRANVSTARDVVRLFRHVEQHRERYPGVVMGLESGVHNSRIPVRLADDAWVTHKTGSLAGVVADAGVMRCQHGDLFLAVLCDRQQDEPLTSVAIGDLALGLATAFGGARTRPSRRP